MVDIKTVGVIGAGQMGQGIAHVCALGGYDVLVNDLDPDKVKEALTIIDGHMSRQVARGVITDGDREAALKRIKFADLAAAAGTDLVIEAATENEDTKKAIFKSLHPHLKPDSLLASNTS